MTYPPNGITECTCGAAIRTRKHGSVAPHIDSAMHTYTRVRQCLGCGRTVRTVEVDSSDLASLRLHAHLYEMSRARAGEEVES